MTRMIAVEGESICNVVGGFTILVCKIHRIHMTEQN